MRRVLGLVLVLLPVLAFAQTFGSGSTGGTFKTNTDKCTRPYLVVPSGLQGGNYAIAGGVQALSGKIACARWSPACSLTATRMAARNNTVVVGGVVCALGIYNSTGSVRLASTATFLCDTASTLYDAPLLAPVTVSPDQTYFMCFTTSGATGTWNNFAPRGTSSTHYTNVDPLIGSLTAGAVAEFPAACAGAANPYACCTGAGVGATCGMPTSFTPAGNITSVPEMVLR